MSTITIETKPCLFCKLPHVLILDREAYDRWQTGAHVQDSFPELSPYEREMLLTGICEPCWNAQIPEDDDDTGF